MNTNSKQNENIDNFDKILKYADLISQVIDNQKKFIKDLRELEAIDKKIEKLNEEKLILLSKHKNTNKGTVIRLNETDLRAHILACDFVSEIQCSINKEMGISSEEYTRLSRYFDNLISDNNYSF